MTDLLRRTCVSAPLWLLGVVFAQGVSASDSDAERIRTKGELDRIAADSKRSYRLEWVAAESEAGQAILQSLEPPADFSRRPAVELDGDAVRLGEWQCSETAEGLLADSEKQFLANDPEAARVGYAEATKVDPNCYVAHSHVGDTFLRTGNETMAVVHYNRAIELNPNDHKTFVYRGHAHLRQGDGDLALDDFRTALTLRPHYWLVGGILSNYEGYPVVFRDARLQAPARIVRTAKRGYVAQVLEQARDTPWEDYALCRAIWRGEGLAPPGSDQSLSRKERRRAARQRQQERDIAEGETQFDMAEERECLAVALEAWARQREPSKPAPDMLSPFETLHQARTEGLFEQALLYGVAAQRFSHTMIILGDAQRQRMREFVERFVLLPLSEVR